MAKKLSSLVGEAIQALSAVREELKKLEEASDSARQKEALDKITVQPEKEGKKK